MFVGRRGAPGWTRLAEARGSPILVPTRRAVSVFVRFDRPRTPPPGARAHAAADPGARPSLLRAGRVGLEPARPQRAAGSGTSLVPKRAPRAGGPDRRGGRHRRRLRRRLAAGSGVHGRHLRGCGAPVDLEALPLFATALLIVGLEIILLGNPGGWTGLGVGAAPTPSYREFLPPAADPILVLFFEGFLLAPTC